MKFDLVTIGDSFLDFISGPIKPIMIKGEFKLGSKKVAGETSVLGGIVSNDFGERRTNLSSNVVIHGGGSASNTAVAMAKLGGKCGIITRVGDDSHGKFIVEQLGRYPIDLSHVKSDNNSETGVSILLLTSEGTRASVTSLGANANLGLDDIDLEYVSKAKAILFTNFFLHSRIAQEINKDFLSIIRKQVGHISLDPGPIPFHYRRKQILRILPLLGYIDTFFLTLNEAKIILGKNRPEEIVTRLLRKGLKSVVIKMGAKGSIVGTNKFTKYIPTIEIGEVIDTTGAGDVYAAAYILKLIRDSFTIEHSARFANVAASLKCLRVGRNGYPTLEEVTKASKNSMVVDF